MSGANEYRLVYREVWLMTHMQRRAAEMTDAALCGTPPPRRGWPYSGGFLDTDRRWRRRVCRRCLRAYDAAMGGAQ